MRSLQVCCSRETGSHCSYAQRDAVSVAQSDAADSCLSCAPHSMPYLMHRCWAQAYDSTPRRCDCRQARHSIPACKHPACMAATRCDSRGRAHADSSELNRGAHDAAGGAAATVRGAVPRRVARVHRRDVRAPHAQHHVQRAPRRGPSRPRPQVPHPRSSSPHTATLATLARTPPGAPRLLPCPKRRTPLLALLCGGSRPSRANALMLRYLAARATALLGRRDAGGRGAQGARAR